MPNKINTAQECDARNEAQKDKDGYIKSFNYKLFMQLLYIDEETRVGKIQNEFNAYYPFLRIDFLKQNGLHKIRTHKQEKINIGKEINEIDVDGKRTVAQVKKDFKDIFGLTAEVFRKSGNVWIETSLTDDWTLEQQNREAEFIGPHNKNA